MKGLPESVRGGSWNNNRNNARCAYRNRNEPDNFNNNIGFRLVRSTSWLYVCRKCKAAVSFLAEASHDGRVTPCPRLFHHSRANIQSARRLGIFPAAGMVCDSIWEE